MLDSDPWRETNADPDRQHCLNLIYVHWQLLSRFVVGGGISGVIEWLQLRVPLLSPLGDAMAQQDNHEDDISKAIKESLQVVKR